MPGTDKPQYPRLGYSEFDFTNGTFSFVPDGFLEEGVTTIEDYDAQTEEYTPTLSGLYQTSGVSIRVNDGIITEIISS